jgi:hypothetical protein
MKTIVAFFILFFGVHKYANSQVFESYVHQGELGISAGIGHYFGDMNPEINFSSPKFSASIHYTKQFNNYVGLKLSGTYAFLAFADKYSFNNVQRLRNLSFNSDVWEFTASGTFNFFKFNPLFPEYRFTPYVGLGVGIFSYDPYAFLGGEKYYLRNIGTEGQGNALYPDRKPYSTVAYCFPLTIGLKYAINSRMNIFTEMKYRFTTTDYLDDVSTTYAPGAFPLDPTTGVPTAGFFLHDRSYEYGTSIGIEGRQRGNSLANDAFATFQVGISFNLQKYICPKF